MKLTAIEQHHTLTSAQGHENAQNNRDKTASRMTPNQIAHALRPAREWLAKHQ